MVQLKEPKDVFRVQFSATEKSITLPRNPWRFQDGRNIWSLPEIPSARKAWIAPKNTFANPSQSNPNSKHYLLSNKTHPSIWATSSKQKNPSFKHLILLFFSGHFFGGKKPFQPSTGQSSIRPKASHPSGPGLVEILLLRPLGAHISDASLQPCHLGLATWKEGAEKEGVLWPEVIRRVYKKNTFKL